MRRAKAGFAVDMLADALAPTTLLLTQGRRPTPRICGTPGSRTLLARKPKRMRR
jgi:hypothetical protein